MAGGPQGGRVNKKPCDDAVLDVQVSKEYLGRALRIMDALVKALDSRGFKISISLRSYGNKECMTTVSVLGVVHEFELRETFKQVKHEPPKESKKEPAWMHPAYDYIPSGRLTLAISSYVGDGGRNSWSDGKKQKIEDCLNDFIIGLIKASVIDRARVVKREQEEKERIELARRRAEEERIREEQKKRIQALITEAQSWKQSQLIREYVAAVKEAVIKRHGDIIPGSEIDQWLKWASEQADRFDPLAPKSPPTMSR